MLDAAKTAENVLVTGQAPPVPGESSLPGFQEDMEQEEQEQESGPRPSSPTPSTSTTALDVSSLTPQTYLVRPTRPDANRNRGRKAFKRRPPPPTAAAQSNENQASTSAGSGPATPATPIPTISVVPETQEPEVDDDVEPLPEEDELEEEMIEEMEHLQLSLEEAWFLSAGLGVLKIYDSESVRTPPRSQHRICS